MKKIKTEEILKGMLVVILILLMGIVVLAVLLYARREVIPNAGGESGSSVAAVSELTPDAPETQPSGDTEDSEKGESGENKSASGRGAKELTLDEYIPEEDIIVGNEENGASALGEVPESYFNDALFVGDSRTVGLKVYGDFDWSGFYCKTGISLNALFQYPQADEFTGSTLTQTLWNRNYSKVYVMIGVNDIASATNSAITFAQEYDQALRRIEAIEPGAKIFVQSIIPVTRWKESSSRLFPNSVVLKRNEALKGICDGETRFYVDINEVLTDSEGYLLSNLSGDGLHLNEEGYQIWRTYLVEHGYVEE